MEIEHQLRDLGLTPNESRVYLTLLRIGESRAGRIAKEARLERTSTYAALSRLVRKGLASYAVEANRKLFDAGDPSGFTSYYQEKVERAKLVIPALLAIKSLKNGEREHERLIKFSGYAGVKTVLRDVLKTCKDKDEYVILGSENQLSEKLPTFARIFVKQKDARKIKAKILVRMGRKSHQGPLSKYTSYRMVPHDIISPTVVSVYGSKVSMILWSENPEAVIIDDAPTAKTFRSYFDFMWGHAKTP